MNGRETADSAMLLPDYAGGSLLNLMASIEAACGGPGRGYAPLRQAPPELGTVRHLVLLVVDGMGEVLLQSGPAGAFMRAHQRGVMTSVFPTTTASAITTVLTGLAPAAHGLTGWHLYSGELDQVIAPLPLWARGKRHPDAHAERWCKQVFVADPLADRLARECHVVSPWFICDSPYNLHHTGKAERWPYRGLDGLFETLEKLLRQADAPTYTYAYYGEIDRLGHEFGIGSPQVAAELAAVDKALEAFAGRVRGLDVGVVATADHGFLDNPPRSRSNWPTTPSSPTHSIARCAASGGLPTPMCGPSARRTSRPPWRASWTVASRRWTATRYWPGAGTGRDPRIPGWPSGWGSWCW